MWYSCDIIVATTLSLLSSPRKPKVRRQGRRISRGKNKFVRIVGNELLRWKFSSKNQCTLVSRCRILAPYVYIFICWRRKARRGWLSLGMLVGFLRHQFAATVANFEQVEQSGIEWSFGDLAEWKIARSNFPVPFSGPLSDSTSTISVTVSPSVRFECGIASVVQKSRWWRELAKKIVCIAPLRGNLRRE